MIAVPLPHASTLVAWARLLAASAGLAYGLTLAHFPAALLLGPMLVAIVFGVRGARIRIPKPGFQAAQALVGCLVAQSVTAEIVGTMAGDGLLILAVVLVTVVAGAVVGWVLTRLKVLPGATAAWGSSPGGAAAMVAMSEDYGSDPRLVAFMQYVRVALVVVSASVVARLLTDLSAPASPSSVAADDPSFLAVLSTLAIAAVGAGVALALKLPGGALIGPMILGAILHASGIVSMTLPGPLLDVAYATIGWYVGLRFTRETVQEAMGALPGVLAATVGLIVLCGGWAFGITYLLPVDFLTAFLATSPGGLDSVAIIAMGSKVDVSFVLAVQTLRLFVVLMTGPILAKWIGRSAPVEA